MSFPAQKGQFGFSLSCFPSHYGRCGLFLKFHFERRWPSWLLEYTASGTCCLMMTSGDDRPTCHASYSVFRSSRIAWSDSLISTAFFFCAARSSADIQSMRLARPVSVAS